MDEATLTTEKVLTEEYIGKLPEFLEIEKLFAELCRKFREDERRVNPNKLPENDKICEIFAKVFGLKKFYLWWQPSPGINAYTVEDGAFIIFGDAADILKCTKGKGFYDVDHKTIITAYGTCGLLSNRLGLTGGELTGIYLHEIGHNFDKSPYIHIGFFLKHTLSKIPSIVEEHNRMKLYYRNEIMTADNAVYKSNKRRSNTIDHYDKEMEKYANKGFLPTLCGCIDSIGELVLSKIYSRPIQKATLDRRKGEQWADSHAVTYGYGVELMTAFAKFDKFYKSYQTKELSNTTMMMKDFKSAMYNLAASLVECHDTDWARCRDSIVKLRRDLEKEDYPPGMKAALLKEIKELEDIYEGFQQMSPDKLNKYSAYWAKRLEDYHEGSLNKASKKAGYYQM